MDLITKIDPRSPIAEAFRTIRTNIQFSSLDKDMKKILVTSSSPGEGKTSIICNLAVTMALTGKKVLLMDADLRKPKINRRFELNNHQGFTNVLAEQMYLKDAIIKSGTPNLYILTSGPKPPNPSEILGSNRMKEFLEEISGHFDYILIDSPPLLAVTDAAILSTQVDGTILVVESGKTEVSQAVESKKHLEKVGGQDHRHHPQQGEAGGQGQVRLLQRLLRFDPRREESREEEKMIDLHCHILPGVDDGSDSMEESLAMARMAVEDGITDMAATPHYFEGQGAFPAEKMEERVRILRQSLKEASIPLRIHTGHEIHLSPGIVGLIKGKEAAPLAHSRYVLVELPFLTLPPFAESLIHQMRLSGHIPILAHPERNGAIAEDPNRLLPFLELGALAQLNGGSLLGANGKEIKRAAETMLTHGMIHVVASDAHHSNVRRPLLSKARNAVAHLAGKEIAEKLFEIHPGHILNDRDFEPETAMRCRRRKNIFYFRKR